MTQSREESFEKYTCGCAVIFHSVQVTTVRAAVYVFISEHLLCSV